MPGAAGSCRGAAPSPPAPWPLPRAGPAWPQNSRRCRGLRTEPRVSPAGSRLVPKPMVQLWLACTLTRVYQPALAHVDCPSLPSTAPASPHPTPPHTRQGERASPGRGSDTSCPRRGTNSGCTEPRHRQGGGGGLCFTMPCPPPVGGMQCPSRAPGARRCPPRQLCPSVHLCRLLHGAGGRPRSRRCPRLGKGREGPGPYDAGGRGWGAAGPYRTRAAPRPGGYGARLGGP